MLRMSSEKRLSLTRSFNKQQSILCPEIEDKIVEDARRNLLRKRYIKEKLEKALNDHETLNQSKFKNL